MISTPDCSRRVLVTKLLGTTILAELVFISSGRRLLLFITWGHSDSAAFTMDSSRVWKKRWLRPFMLPAESDLRNLDLQIHLFLSCDHCFLQKIHQLLKINQFSIVTFSKALKTKKQINGRTQGFEHPTLNRQHICSMGRQKFNLRTLAEKTKTFNNTYLERS